ncbi:MAG TPA: glycosyltransferase family 2 protein [Dongiaceae bacterium]|jgi:glycosyltransferase involved in cell wall biosynthesis|nr:glycosyltransferase family 2 protein [Dongiaceae bacterium]
MNSSSRTSSPAEPIRLDTGDRFKDLRLAVLVPCYNEAAAIERVVGGFRAALPGARIMVFDNNSTDATVALAAKAGAETRHVQQQGKGHVVRRMFADVEADVYLLVDGDATYDAASAPAMVDRLLQDGLDMVVGCRRDSESAAYRRGHRFGNRLLTEFVAHVFGRAFTDILSGYRVFSRRFVKSFPALATGFEIETELTVHALELRMPIGEVETPYYARPEGSASKLHTYRDGWRILTTIIRLYQLQRPLSFFTSIAAVLAAASVLLAIPLVITYFQTGLVPRLPTAVLTTGMMVLASLSLTCGLILDNVTRGRQELKRLHYLGIEGPGRR